jgi:hypothetical protein
MRDWEARRWDREWCIEVRIPSLSLCPRLLKNQESALDNPQFVLRIVVEASVDDEEKSMSPVNEMLQEFGEQEGVEQ